VLQLEIPPVWANSKVTVDVAASARNGGSPAARRVEWSGPYGEEFASDKSASAMTYPAELLTVIVSGTSRRNVLGAIAFEKNDCNFPRRRQPRRIKEARTATTQDSFIRTQKNRRPRQAQPLRKNQEENRFDLTNSFRNGHLARICQASANPRRQRGHSPSCPLSSAENPVGCGIVVIALNANGARWA
jgi:hypothetical protein